MTSNTIDINYHGTLAIEDQNIIEEFKRKTHQANN